MTGIRVPDTGAFNLDAADGNAFNGEVGRGIAAAVLGIITRQPGVNTICDLGCGNGYLAGELGKRGKEGTETKAAREKSPEGAGRAEGEVRSCEKSPQDKQRAFAARAR